MPAIPDEFPVDPNGWRVCVRGTGDEPQGFTSARDIGKAVVELLAWEGEWVGSMFISSISIDKDDNTGKLVFSGRDGLAHWLQISQSHLLMHTCPGAHYVCCRGLAYIQRSGQSDGDVLR